MKSIRSTHILAITAVLVIFFLSACEKNKAEKTLHTEVKKGTAAALPSHTAPEHIFGKIKETMNSGGYTYLLLEDNGKETWVAIPATSVRVGEEVMVKPGAPMPKFHSKTLNRTFDTIIFSSGIVGDNGHSPSMAQMPAPGPMTGMEKHEGRRMPPMVREIDITERPEGAVTVSSLYAEPGSVADKTVTVKGRVVKVSPKIMGKNWVHIQDGTGKEEELDYDITVTTMDLPETGTIVTATGTAHANKDFGAGYKYDMIIEDAKVVVEAN